MPNTNHSLSQLRHALQLSEQIAALEAELKSVLSGDDSDRRSEAGNGKQASAEPKPRKKKSGMSPEGKARIAAAQRARWAKSKGEKADATVEAKPAAKAAKPGKKKRTMSPEARARIVAAQKARWAKFRKGKNH
jgi:hypothetical protein